MGVEYHSNKTRVKMSLAHRGKHLSLEHRIKIGQSRLGHPVREETREKLRQAHLGLKFSNEHKERIRASMFGKNLGKHHSPEVCERMSQNRRGSLNHNWRGGTSNEPYGPEFTKELKAQIRDRDNHLCQMPGCYLPPNGKEHPVHHIDYVKRNNQFENLITLCLKHNFKVNVNRVYWTELFQAVQLQRGLIR